MNKIENAIENLKEIKKINNEIANKSNKADVVRTEETCDLAIKALEKQLNDRWVPVSERMPDVFDYVLVTSNAGGRTIAHRMPNQTNWYDLHSTVVETGVIAWQPLPPSYKGE